MSSSSGMRSNIRSHRKPSTAPPPATSHGEKLGSFISDQVAQSFQNFVYLRLLELHGNPSENRIYIPSWLLADWYCEHFRRNDFTVVVSRIINCACRRGRLSRLRKNRTRTFGRGFVWEPAGLAGVRDLYADYSLIRN